MSFWPTVLGSKKSPSCPFLLVLAWARHDPGEAVSSMRQLTLREIQGRALGHTG